MMSRTRMDMSDISALLVDEGIDLPNDPQTTQHLKLIQLQEAIRQRKVAEQRKERQWFWSKVFGILTLILTGGTVGYVKLAPAEAEAPATATESKEASEDLGKRVDKTERKIEKLGVIAVEQQEQIVDSVEYISKQIEAAHPRQVDELKAVPEPKSLRDAKDRIADRKRKAAAGKLLEIDTGP